MKMTKTESIVGRSLSAKALKSAIHNASSLEDLKSLVAQANVDRILNEDGTICGLYYCAASGKRGAVLQVSIKRETPNGFTTSMIVDGKDFRTVYREIVNAIATHYGLLQGNEMIVKMHDSTEAFLIKNGLQLKQVTYEQVSKIGSQFESTEQATA